ncbi:MAG: hypothetical protein IPP11_08345 [Chitinophagaceae bacterium]|nr:hypothetical protein [Chitinophagaceae bacterium]
MQQPLNENFKPTLAIVFISVKQDRKAICEILRKEEIDVFGATSCGEFISGYQSEGEIVVLLFDMAKSFILFYLKRLMIEASVMPYLNWQMMHFKNLRIQGVIVCSTGMTAKGEYFDGETFVRSLENYFGTDKIFFGGMAGDDWTFSGTYVFNNQQETDLGIVALVVDMDKVSLNGMAITGWKPMGISRTVTKKAKDATLYN